MRTTIGALIIATCLPAEVLAQGAETEPWPGFNEMTVEEVEAYVQANRDTMTADQINAAIDRIAAGYTLEELRAKVVGVDLIERPEPLPIDRVIATVDIGLVSKWEVDPMGAATEAARNYLPAVFNVVFESKSYQSSGFWLKARISSVNNSVFWVGNISEADGAFSGQIISKPFGKRDLFSGGGVAQGPRVRFGKEDILDWSLLGKGGRMFGHFTTRVLIQNGATHLENAENLITGHPLPEGW